MNLHGLCLKKVKLTVWNRSFVISFISSNVGGQLGFKRHQVNYSNKDTSWKQNLIQVLTRNVSVPKMSLSFWFYLARWIFQAAWYNRFFPFSISHGTFTNSASVLKLLPGNGDDRGRYWLPVSLERAGEHVDTEVPQKMVCHQSQSGICSCELQVSRNLIHSSIQPRRAWDRVLSKGGDMETTNPRCCKWTPGSFWPHSRQNCTSLCSCSEDVSY